MSAVSAVRERNAATILDAAADVLSADPAAGMGDIATRAGLGRATLYRHYPTREALIDALRTRVRMAFRALVTALEADEDLGAFVDGVLGLREAALVLGPATEDRSRHAWAPVAAVLARLEPELPADWAAVSLRALIRAAGHEVDAGRLPRADAAALVVRTLRR